MSNCIICNKPISDAEFLERYKELLAQGVIPTMINICSLCRQLSIRERAEIRSASRRREGIGREIDC